MNRTPRNLVFRQESLLFDRLSDLIEKEELNDMQRTEVDLDNVNTVLLKTESCAKESVPIEKHRMLIRTSKLAEVRYNHVHARLKPQHEILSHLQILVLFFVICITCK